MDASPMDSRPLSYLQNSVLRFFIIKQGTHFDSVIPFIVGILTARIAFDLVVLFCVNKGTACKNPSPIHDALLSAGPRAQKENCERHYCAAFSGRVSWFRRSGKRVRCQLFSTVLNLTLVVLLLQSNSDKHFWEKGNQY